MYIHSAALQAFALHFQTSNFILIKVVQQRRVPRDQTRTVYVDHRVTRQLQRAVKYTYGDYFAGRIDCCGFIRIHLSMLLTMVKQFCPFVRVFVV